MSRTYDIDIKPARSNFHREHGKVHDIHFHNRGSNHSTVMTLSTEELLDLIRAGADRINEVLRDGHDNPAA